MTGYFEAIEKQALDALDTLVLPESSLKAEDVNFLSYMWGEEEGGVPMLWNTSGPASESGVSQQAMGAQSAKTHTPAVLRWERFVRICACACVQYVCAY